MYCNCPKCGKLMKVDLYLLNDIEDEERVKCPKCKSIFEYNNYIMDITNYADIQENIKSKCVHLDSYYQPTIKNTLSGYRCLYCGKFFTYNEYMSIVKESHRKLRNLDGRERSRST